MELSTTESLEALKLALRLALGFCGKPEGSFTGQVAIIIYTLWISSLTLELKLIYHFYRFSFIFHIYQNKKLKNYTLDFFF